MSPAGKFTLLRITALWGPRTGELGEQALHLLLLTVVCEHKVTSH